MAVQTASYASGKSFGTTRDEDPFRHLVAAPANETPQEREARLQAEAKAKKVSEEIDEVLNREKQERSKDRCVRVLLLGQSESGKSTLQRQFTLMHAPDTFDAERPNWRLVVFLNVVRSIQRILKVLNADIGKGSTDGEVDQDMPQQKPLPTSSKVSPPGGKSPADYVAQMSLQLSPITSLEETIIHRLIGPEERDAGPSSTKHTVKGSSGLNGVLEGSDREFFVRPTSSWRGKSVIDKIKRGVDAVAGSGRKSIDSNTAPSIDWDDKSDPGRIFTSCGQDLIALWTDPWVRAKLAQWRVRLEEVSGFFLNDLDRITAARYLPSDEDILRARIKTVGVSEYIFPQDIHGVEWRLYDVGGARTQRHAWVPYFDSVDSIIFLAPLSPFDTALPEDRKVNCLEDSLLIWKELCSNKLLAKVPLVLFLNKSDLLRKKLADGVQVSRYVVSYGDRPNEYEHVEKYFRTKFEAIRKQHSTTERPVFVHVTSCVDQKTTAAIISHVQDILMRENLKNSSLM